MMRSITSCAASTRPSLNLRLMVCSDTGAPLNIAASSICHDQLVPSNPCLERLTKGDIVLICCAHRTGWLLIYINAWVSDETCRENCPWIVQQIPDSCVTDEVLDGCCPVICCYAPPVLRSVMAVGCTWERCTKDDINVLGPPVIGVLPPEHITFFT